MRKGENMNKLSTKNLDEMKKNEFALVDFFATWCGPCMFMKPFFEKAENKLNQMGVVCYELNVDESEQFASANKIQFVPTVILFKKGEEVARFTGAKDEEGIIDFVVKSIVK